MLISVAPDDLMSKRYSEISSRILHRRCSTGKIAATSCRRNGSKEAVTLLPNKLVKACEKPKDLKRTMNQVGWGPCTNKCGDDPGAPHCEPRCLSGDDDDDNDDDDEDLDDEYEN